MSVVSKFLRRMFGRSSYDDMKDLMRLRLFRWLYRDAQNWLERRLRSAGLTEQKACGIAEETMDYIAHRVEF